MTQSARGASNSCASSRPCEMLKFKRFSPILPIPASSRGANSISPSARKIVTSTICIETCCACAARIRDSKNKSRVRWTVRCLTQIASRLRFFGTDNDDRLLIVNYGPRVRLEPVPEPLLAPPLGFQWETLWTSDSPRYGGPGPTMVATDERWLLPAESAVALRATRRTSSRPHPSKRKQGTE